MRVRCFFQYIICGEKSLLDWPENGDQGLRQRVYRKLRSDIYDLKEVHDPIVAHQKKRIVEKKNNCIVVKKSEVSQLVNSVYHETKGEGAKKLNGQISHTYCGLWRRIIQRNLNSMKQQTKSETLFYNKAPLRPIKASKIQERYQVDLVSMVSLPGNRAFSLT